MMMTMVNNNDVVVQVPSTSTTAAADDWRAFCGKDIPSKGIQLPPLFFETLDRLEKNNETQQHKQHKQHHRRCLLDILEIGCGCGELSNLLHYDRGHHVVGIDVNSDAIERARRMATFKDGGGGGSGSGEEVGKEGGGGLTFQVVDVTTTNKAKEEEDDEDNINNLFDFCILQLLLSVVGGKEERRRALQYAADRLKSGIGTIYLSCSGVSDDINESYAQLYRQDAPATGEEYTYYSRDASNDGKILYTTHHFKIDEVKKLLEDTGFDNIYIEQKKEASSRRPKEAAYFLYATATKKRK